MVPEGWSISYLDNIATKVMVGIASAATHAYTDSGVRMLRNLNIKEGWIDDSNILHVDEHYEVQHKNKRLKTGDILTVRTGYPGLSAVVGPQYDNAQCFTSLITRLDQNLAIPEYVCRFINSEYGKKFITSGEAGGAQKNVNAGMLKKMRIPLPPLPEQRKIAKILQTWDRAIATTEKLINASKQQKKALMQQLLTGKKRFAGFEGEWEEIDLEETVDRPICYGVLKPGENIEKGIPLLRIQDLQRRNLNYDKMLKITPELHNEFKRTILRTGDLVISIVGTLGKILIIPKELNGANITRAFAVIGVDKMKLDSQFLAQFLVSPYVQEWLLNTATGNAQKVLNIAAIRKLKINRPLELEQKKIAKALCNADGQINILESRLASLKQEKKALMQQLLTGKRRVKVDAL